MELEDLKRQTREFCAVEDLRIIAVALDFDYDWKPCVAFNRAAPQKPDENNNLAAVIKIVQAEQQKEIAQASYIVSYDRQSETITVGLPAYKKHGKCVKCIRKPDKLAERISLFDRNIREYTGQINSATKARQQSLECQRQ